MKKKYVIPILGFLIISLLACIEKPEEGTAESTENNEVSFINNPSKFFYLSKLGKSQQPDGSYVCWAACLANIHNGFYPKKNLTYCKILDENGLACSKSRVSGTTIKIGFNFVKPIKEII